MHVVHVHGYQWTHHDPSSIWITFTEFIGGGHPQWLWHKIKVNNSPGRDICSLDQEMWQSWCARPLPSVGRIRPCLVFSSGRVWWGECRVERILMRGSHRCAPTIPALSSFFLFDLGSSETESGQTGGMVVLGP